MIRKPLLVLILLIAVSCQKEEKKEEMLITTIHCSKKIYGLYQSYSDEVEFKTPLFINETKENIKKRFEVLKKSVENKENTLQKIQEYERHYYNFCMNYLNPKFIQCDDLGMTTDEKLRCMMSEINLFDQFLPKYLEYKAYQGGPLTSDVLNVDDFGQTSLFLFQDNVIQGEVIALKYWNRLTEKLSNISEDYMNSKSVEIVNNINQILLLKPNFIYFFLDLLANVKQSILSKDFNGLQKHLELLNLNNPKTTVGKPWGFEFGKNKYYKFKNAEKLKTLVKTPEDLVNCSFSLDGVGIVCAIDDRHYSKELEDQKNKIYFTSTLARLSQTIYSISLELGKDAHLKIGPVFKSLYEKYGAPVEIEYYYMHPTEDKNLGEFNQYGRYVYKTKESGTLKDITIVLSYTWRLSNIEIISDELRMKAVKEFQKVFKETDVAKRYVPTSTDSNSVIKPEEKRVMDVMGLIGE